MYVREETIEEENLDWDELTKASEDNQDKLIEDTKEEAAQTPVSKPKKTFLNNRAKIQKIGPKFALKNELSDLFKQNAEISLVFTLLFVPYFVGFLVSYFVFFIYGGMPLGSFITIEKGNFHFELWSIGAYFFITLGVIGTILMYFKDR